MGEVETFKKNINNYVKDLLGRFKDLQFYVGESMDNDAMIVILDYKEYKGEERPVLLAFKHGLEGESLTKPVHFFYFNVIFREMGNLFTDDTTLYKSLGDIPEFKQMASCSQCGGETTYACSLPSYSSWNTSAFGKK